MDYLMQLKLKRIEQGLTQEEVDKLISYPDQTTSRIERGMIANVHIIKRLIDFFGGRIRIDFGE
jgi:DNA-binding XRE family transcriptional regulator